MPRKRIAQAPTETPDALETVDAPETNPHDSLPTPDTIAGLIALLPLTHPSVGWPSTAGKLTQHTARIIADAICEGNYLTTAARLAGISPNTLTTWQQRADTDTETHYSPYRILRLILDKAEAEAEATLIRNVQRVGANDWKAHASVLGRRFRERWSEQRFGGESGAGGVTINVGIALTSSTSSPQVVETQLLSVPRLDDE